MEYSLDLADNQVEARQVALVAAPDHMSNPDMAEEAADILPAGAAVRLFSTDVPLAKILKDIQNIGRK